jgi:hypothetical protein
MKALVEVEIISYNYCGQTLCKIQLPTELLSQSTYFLSEIAELRRVGILKFITEKEAQ